MTFKRILIANRGEIALRIARACADVGAASVAIFSEDDAGAAHVRAADESYALKGAGPRAYLDGAQVIALAKAQECDALHPGYGFLAENATFAAACESAGVRFIGPGAETLAILGDKARARRLAQEQGVPVLRGVDRAVTIAEARAFMDSGGGRSVILKASAGGGGRGMRPVHRLAELESAYERCVAEALASFGDGALYVEDYIVRARHIEVQVIGDASGAVSHAFDRDCTLQRRRQKIIEIAPAPFVSEALRERLLADSLTLAKAVRLQTVATMEFILDADNADSYAFMEANARIQVEHTITEEAFDIDLVRAQIETAAGKSLKALGLAKPPRQRGAAIQCRVCAETMSAEGDVRPSDGVITLFEPPIGPGVRVDSAARTGGVQSGLYDSLLAKIIVSGANFEEAARRARRALSACRVEGPEVNLHILRALLEEEVVLSGAATTTTIEEHAAAFAALAPAQAPRAGTQHETPEGYVAASAPLRGSIVQVDVVVGDVVGAGQQLAVLEAMKMQHVVAAAQAGVVRAVLCAMGETLDEGAPLVFLEPVAGAAADASASQGKDPDFIREDLAETQRAIALTLDAARPESMARRHKTNLRSARENIDDLVDPGSFIEYGALAVAAQRRRRTLDDLVANTPGDGMVTGIGAVNGAHFPEEKARTAVLAYDYTVLAGTQGYFNHHKTDRILHLAEDQKLPVVFFAEGGGGRPGDTDVPGVAGLDTPSFHAFARLSGLVPRIAIAAGWCFAGNAAFFGCADITIGVKGANIGMGGPAMIEGGGLGVFAPEDIGPIEVQRRNGVLDLVVADEGEAVEKTKALLGIFQGALSAWRAPDQRLLRHVVPENRLRVYEVRDAIRGLFDEGSFVELRDGYGVGVVTGFARLEGRPIAVIANNPKHLGGALDSEGSEKAARFLQLCDGFDIPVVSLIDTPGFMVGPDAEKLAGVRRMSSLFVVGATVSIPVFAIVLRKCYGLGGQAMAAGSTLTPFFTASWPSGEFGGMGLEGAVRLGYRKELAAEKDPAAQKALYDKLVANMYERGKAISMARALEIDAVIDPTDTRAWLLRGLKSVAVAHPREGKKRPFIDTW